jgi:hypothetical protein
MVAYRIRINFINHSPTFYYESELYQSEGIAYELCAPDSNCTDIYITLDNGSKLVIPIRATKNIVFTIYKVDVPE